MDLIFHIIERLLEERKKTISTEQEQGKCDFVQHCLDCRPLFYTLSFVAQCGMFKFLGVDDTKRINEYVAILNLPQLRAKYAYRHIIYADQQDNDKKSE